MVKTAGSGSMSIAHVPARFFERVAVGVREKHDRLFGMVDAIGGQARLVVDDERDAIDAGNVSGGDDDEVGPGDARLELDALDEAAGHGAADRGAKEHPRQHEVVDVLRPAGDLGRPSRRGTDWPIAAWSGR